MVDPAWGSPSTVTIKAGLPKTRAVLSLQPCGWWGQQRRVLAPDGRKDAEC